MNIKLEQRPYGPESTPQEIEAIRQRVTYYQDNIILMREMPVPSEFQVDLFHQKLKELLLPDRKYFLLVDLTTTGRASGTVRKKIVEMTNSIRKSLIHVAIFTEKNTLINITARFVLNIAGLDSFSLHRTREQAIKAINNASVS